MVKTEGFPYMVPLGTRAGDSRPPSSGDHAWPGVTDPYCVLVHKFKKNKNKGIVLPKKKRHMWVVLLAWSDLPLSWSEELGLLL